jgi:hypothetical protein
MSDLLLCHALRVSMQVKCPVCGAEPTKLCVKVERPKRDWDRGVSNSDFGPEGQL